MNLPHDAQLRLDGYLRDVERCVGVASAERTEIVKLGEELQEWVKHQSTPAFPASVLGL